MLGGFVPSVASLGLQSPWEQDIAQATGGDPPLTWLVKAIISVESGWNPSAIRLEPTHVCPLTGEIGDASYGLMQVLLCTARGLDPTMDQGRLMDPPTNLSIGTEYLRQQVAHYGLEGGISAYNAGHPISGNQGYVQDVLTYYTFFLNQDPGTVIPSNGTGTAAFPWPDLSQIDPIFLIGGTVLLLLLWGRGRT